MTNRLSRFQAIVLGLVVLLLAGAGTVGLLAIAAKQGYGGESFTVVVGYPEVHDIVPGTPVRIRGIEAGQVVALEYPDGDGPILVRMQLDVKFRDKLFADAKAQIQPTGLLGSKIINIQPGAASSGPFLGESLTSVPTPDLAGLAAEGEKTLYEIREMVGDVRSALRKVDGVVETEAGQVRGLVKDGRATIQSVKENSEAVSRLPIVRSYVVNATALLDRPDCRHEVMTYNAVDIFEPDTAILTESGRVHLNAVANWVKSQPNKNSEVVVVSAYESPSLAQTDSQVEQLTRKQAEIALAYLKSQSAHKMGWWSRRKMTSLGLGSNGSPIAAAEKLPANSLQVFVFTPQ